jgi:hypothetical protein
MYVSGVNVGSAGVSNPRPSIDQKGGESMAGANTGSAGVSQPRPPAQRPKR